MHHLYAAIRKWNFWQVFGYWGILFLVSDLVNEFIIRSWLLTDMVQALLGIFLLFFPSGLYSWVGGIRKRTAAGSSVLPPCWRLQVPF